MAYPDEFNKCVINVGSLGQEKATPRAEFMEEVEFLVLGIQKQKEVRLEEGQVPVLSLIICVTLGNFLTSNSSLIM